MAILIGIESKILECYLNVYRFSCFHGSFMNIFTGIPLCTSYIFKWVFMAIVNSFEHQEYRSVYYANLNGFSWQFQLVLSIKNIGVLCKFIWVFMLVLGTHLLEYKSVHLANVNGYSWQFEFVLSIKNIRVYIMQI